MDREKLFAGFSVCITSLSTLSPNGRQTFLNWLYKSQYVIQQNVNGLKQTLITDLWCHIDEIFQDDKGDFRQVF